MGYRNLAACVTDLERSGALIRIDEELSADRSELTWTGPMRSVPDEALDLLTGVLRREPLQVVAELECTRRRVGLEDDAGRPLAAVDHDTVTVHGGAHDGLRFHEVELETETGTADDRVTPVLRRLQDAGARPTDAGPKLGRAIGRSGVDRSAPTPRDPTMREVLARGMGSSLSRLVEYDVRIRTDPGHPPPLAIHQARVEARRLRSDLRTVASLLDPIWLAHVRDDLWWLGTTLGEARECDVLAGYLASARQQGAADDEGLAVLLAAVRRRRDAACRDVTVVLDSDRYLSLLDRLHAAVSNPPVTDPSVLVAPARDVLPPLVGAEWRKLRNAVRRARRQPTDHHLHRVRVRAKQLRYASELAVPAIGKQAHSTAKSAKRLQTVLGHHQDAVVAEGWLRRQAVAGPGIVGFAAGQLATAQRRQQLEARADWASRWHRLEVARRRRWLTRAPG